MSMKKAAISDSVKSVVLGLRNHHSPNPIAKLARSGSHDTSHLKESIMTVQEEELPTRVKVTLEIPVSGGRSKRVQVRVMP